jgi:hypothetical protein
VIKSFRVFPTGFAGAALLLLRISISAGLAVTLMTPTPTLLCGIIITLIPELLGGFCTRILAAASACVMVFVCIGHGGWFGLYSGLQGVDALVLSMLGAGGYSVDSCLFGRRVIDLER